MKNQTLILFTKISSNPISYVHISVRHDIFSTEIWDYFKLGSPTKWVISFSVEADSVFIIFSSQGPKINQFLPSCTYCNISICTLKKQLLFICSFWFNDTQTQKTHTHTHYSELKCIQYLSVFFFEFQ